jgi:hypothetical protein
VNYEGVYYPVAFNDYPLVDRTVYRRWMHVGNDPVHIVWCDDPAFEFHPDLLPTEVRKEATFLFGSFSFQKSNTTA